MYKHTSLSHLKLYPPLWSPHPSTVPNLALAKTITQANVLVYHGKRLRQKDCHAFEANLSWINEF